MKQHLFYLLNFILLIIMNIPVNGQYIQVDTSFTKEELVKKFIGENNNCISISNINFSGYDTNLDDISYGYFTKGSSNFEINEGIVLSTGRAKDAKGPNTTLQDFYVRGWEGDQDLIDILRKSNLNYDNILNATYLEFDFVSNQYMNQISFEYMFLSEEYQSNNCRYSDAFAFLIKKADNSEPYKNIAVVPNTIIPVTSLTINGARDCQRNITYFGGFNSSNSPTNFNGQTKVLTANTDITPGVKYHIKLVIADHGDANGRYDSGVFLKAGSFIGTKSLGNDFYICPGNTKIIDAEIKNATYQWYKDGDLLEGETQQLLTISTPGYYEVLIKQTNGCEIKAYQNVKLQLQPDISSTEFEFCDIDLDGNFQIDLTQFNDRIIGNFEDELFTVKYYENQADANNNTTTNIRSIHLTESINSKTIFIRIDAGTCGVNFLPVTFKLKQKSIYNLVEKEVCDTNLDGQETINLSDYISEIASNLEGSVTYYLTENDAKNQTNQIDSSQIINSDKTFYVRFKQIDLCDNIAPIKIILKTSKKSEVLKDVSICKNSTTTLDAGPDFDSYLWNTGETTSSISGVKIGQYTVRLEHNGCFFTQEVNVTAEEEPIINEIDIQGSTVTIKASGSTPPYYYSLDNGPYQTSNIFYNVTLGNHFVRVKSNCDAVTKEFSVIKLINFISPNGDGKNDVLDYSQLKNKMNPKFIVYDRFGKLVFEGTSSNNYTWDGKIKGVIVPSTSYWYTIEWAETSTSEIKRFSNWILVKNND
jgi:gliding motility-associated-like protein